jgi:uncharacterized protein (DUF488 family)
VRNSKPGTRNERLNNRDGFEAAKRTRGRAAIEVFTIGHSTRTTEEFLALLAAHGIERVADVRTIPRSQHNPQFNREALAAAVRRAGIGYIHFKALGGLRHARKDSINLGWQNMSFRGFADYMQTPEFARAIGRLIGFARKKRIAILCAEAVPWRCHRSLIADALLVRGVAVQHILSGRSARPHTLTPWAKVEGTRITYPAADGEANLPAVAGAELGARSE